MEIEDWRKIVNLTEMLRLVKILAILLWKRKLKRKKEIVVSIIKFKINLNKI